MIFPKTYIRNFKNVKFLCILHKKSNVSKSKHKNFTLMHKMYVKNYTKKERNGKCFMDFLSYFSEHKKNIFLN